MGGARQRLEATHERLVAMLRAMPPDRLDAPAFGDPEEGSIAQGVMHYMRHDSYHLGQIMLLRALQGMPPVD